MRAVPARRARILARLLLPLVLVAAGISVWSTSASADVTTASYDNLRTGWDPNESGLSPANVSASDFGQLFSTPVDGQVYAQPIVVGNQVVAATENNKVYGINKVNGSILWTRNLGPAWPASAIGCGDLVPNIGVTATPVYDPSTQTIYLTAKVNDGADQNNPHWYMHALNVATGAERAGWPVVIQGTPTNSPGKPFNPKTAMQRPGLLLMGGVVYAGFASHCDYGPYVGYVVGVKTATASVSTMWSTVAGSATGESGIWQSGGGLVSDGAGRIIFTTGNGTSPAPGPGTGGQTKLGEAVVRLQVNADGSLTSKDFFSPANNTGLNTNDSDLGAGGPMAIPDGYGTAAHPHLLVQIGKDGRLFLLDRDNLGGTAQGAGGADAVVSQSGPYGGVWGHPAFWGGDGGYVYFTGNGIPLRAFQVTKNASGVPVLSLAGASPDPFGFASGSPVITSSGTTSGSSLVWAIWDHGPTGVDGQLRAYDAIPQNGVMKLRYSAPLGIVSKFSVPATDTGRVYVGTRDGHLIGFGRPATSVLTGAPVNFGSVAVGATGKANLTLTATRALTVTAASTSAPFGVSLAAAKALTAGQSIVIPVTFSPTAAGGTSQTVNITTSAGSVGFDLAGVGTQNGLAASPSPLAFGTIPTGAKSTLSVNIRNTGTTASTITSTRLPAAPFTVALPATGTVIAAGASLAASVTYSPTTAGTNSSSFTITGSTGAVTVTVTGSAVSGSANLNLAPNPLNYGAVLLGTSSSKTFIVSNTGNVNLIVSKAAPPTAPFEVPNPMPEGQPIEGGADLSQDVTFRPTLPGVSSGQYLFGSTDGKGPKAEAVQGVGAEVGNFVSAAANKCVDVNAGAAVAGTAVVIFNCNATAAQQWAFGASGSLRALGLCMDVANAGTADGTPVRMWACNGSGAQNWRVLASGVIQNTNSGKCLDPTGLGTTNGVPLIISVCTGSPAQTWISPQRTGPIAGGPSGRCLDVPSALSVDTNPVQLWDCNGSGAQSWTIARGGQVKALGKCLDVQNAGTAAGTLVWLYTCNGTAAQQWALTTSGKLLNTHSQRCLAPLGGGTVDGTKMQIANCGADPAQKWQLN